MWAAVTARLSARVKYSNWAITGQINTGVGGELKEPSYRQKVSMKFRETQYLEKVPASAFFLLKLPNSAFPLLKVTY